MGAANINEDTGCAILIQNEESLFRLPKYITLFTSEAFAILKALQYIDTHKLQCTIILLDFLSTLNRNKKQNSYELYNSQNSRKIQQYHVHK